LGLEVEMIDLAKLLKSELPASVGRSSRARGVSPIVRRGPSAKRRQSLPTKIMAMLFADAVNFSKLTEPQIPRFLKHFLGAIGNLMSKSEHAPLIKNTWGDGLYFVFPHVRDAGLFALELCQLMVDTDWSKKGLPKAINLR